MAPSRVIGYIRVSTLEQKDEGVSLAAQGQKIEHYTAMHDLDLVEVLADEGLSAKAVDHRPGATKVHDLVRKGKVDGVVVTKLDRLFRRTSDAIAFAELCEKKGVQLHSISENLDTSTAIGSFFFTLMSALAEMERRQVGERTALALAHKQAHGEKTGGEVPYGYDLDIVEKDGQPTKRLIPNQAEQDVIAMMIEWRAAGKSLRHIAHLLMRRGIPTKTGKPVWGIGALGRLLKREMALETAG